MTGGADGMTIPFNPLEIGPLKIDFLSIKTNYFLVLIVVALCSFLATTGPVPLGKDLYLHKGE